jgi:hypothetical protein
MHAVKVVHPSKVMKIILLVKYETLESEKQILSNARLISSIT